MNINKSQLVKRIYGRSFSLFLVFLIVEVISLKGKNAQTGRFIFSESSFRLGAFSGIFQNVCKEKVSYVKQSIHFCMQ